MTFPVLSVVRQCPRVLLFMDGAAETGVSDPAAGPDPGRRAWAPRGARPPRPQAAARSAGGLGRGDDDAGHRARVGDQGQVSRLDLDDVSRNFITASVSSVPDGAGDLGAAVRAGCPCQHPPPGTSAFASVESLVGTPASRLGPWVFRQRSRLYDGQGAPASLVPAT